MTCWSGLAPAEDLQGAALVLDEQGGVLELEDRAGLEDQRGHRRDGGAGVVGDRVGPGRGLEDEGLLDDRAGGGVAGRDGRLGQDHDRPAGLLDQLLGREEGRGLEDAEAGAIILRVEVGPGVDRAVQVAAVDGVGDGLGGEHRVGAGGGAVGDLAGDLRVVDRARPGVDDVAVGHDHEAGHERPAGGAVAGEVGQVAGAGTPDRAVLELIDVLAVGVLVAEELAVELAPEDVGDRRQAAVGQVEPVVVGRQRGPRRQGDQQPVVIAVLARHGAGDGADELDRGPGDDGVPRGVGDPEVAEVAIGLGGVGVGRADELDRVGVVRVGQGRRGEAGQRVREVDRERRRRAPGR